MGRKKKTSEEGFCPPYEESTGVEETDTGGANPKVGVLNQEGKDLAKGPKTSTIIDGKTKEQCDQNEKYDRKSLKDLNHKRSLFGRRRLPSESPRRRDYRKQGVEEREGEAEAVVANGKINKSSSNERMSRRDRYFADKPERGEGQATKVTEIYSKATVDSSDEEIGHGKPRKSRRDMVNSTHFRRRRLSKSPFKIPQRCPLQGCWKGSKDSSKENKGSKNDKQVELEVSYKKDNTTQELHINTKPECKLTKEKNVRTRRRQRKLDATKGPKDETNINTASLSQGKAKSKINITNCCWKKNKKSKHKTDSESTEEYDLSKLSTFPKLTLEKNERHTASSVLKKSAAVDKSSVIGPDNFPEELNPFAEETVLKENENGSGSSVISEGGTIKPTEENGTNFAQPKTVDNKKSCDINQDEYPERLNPFADDNDSETEPTQPKEHGDSNKIDPYQLKSVEENVPRDKSPKVSNDLSIGATGQKSKLHFRWKNLKARRYWTLNNIKHATKVDINRPKSNTAEDKSSVSTVGKDTKNDSTEKHKKRRNWRCNWKSLKTRRCKLTDKKTKYMEVEQTQSNTNSDKHNSQKSVSSLKTSDVNLSGATQKKKKTWRSRLNIRKKKCSEKKKTHKHQSESAVQMTKYKRTKKRWWSTLRRRQNKLSQEKNEDMMDEKVSKLSTFPAKSTLEKNETDTASSVLKKNAAVDRSSVIGPDNYPEELNPFAEETVLKENENGRGPSVISEGGTTKPTEENGTNFAQPKTVDNKKSCDINQDEYPERLNLFADDKDSETEPTQPKEQGDSNKIDPYELKSVEENVPRDKSPKASNDLSIGATGQKSKLHFRWKNLKARRYWTSKDIKHATKVDINRPKSNAPKDKASVSTVGKDTKNDSTEKQKKRRNWWCNWKSLKTRRCKLTDKKTKYMDVEQTQSNSNSDKHNSQKSASSLKTSDVNLSGATQKQKKTWRSRLNIRKKKCSEKKKTHKHQSESAVQMTKYKRTKKRWWSTLRGRQKKLSQEKNEDMMDEKVPEIVEDDKSVYKSKYLQNLNPLTAAQFKSSIKERRVPSWKIESKSDIKIKQRRWWRIRKRHRSRDMGENVSQKDEMKRDKVDEDSDGKERTDFPKKTMTIFKKFKNVVKSRNKNLSTSNCESATVVCDPNAENEKKSPTKLKSKNKSDSKGKNSSSEEKTERKDLSDHKMDRNMQPTLSKLRKSWKRFNKWLDE